MTPIHRTSLAGALGLAFLALSAAASAQDRPTLERLEEYACISADDRGDTYRPTFCAPRCDCLAGPNLSQVSSCEQQPSGIVLIEARPSLSGECLGYCSLNLEACRNDGECSSEEQGTCLFDVAAVCAVPPDVVACRVDEQCDQAKGYSCQLIKQVLWPGLQFGCSRNIGSCAAVGICETNVQQITYYSELAFAPAGGSSPLACELTVGRSQDFSANVSSTDVAECITQVEAVLGAGACIICGDGNLDAGEQCDDGNLTAGDDCAPDCTTE